MGYNKYQVTGLNQYGCLVQVVICASSVLEVYSLFRDKYGGYADEIKKLEGGEVGVWV